MARTARIALDLVLVSLKTVRPAVTKVWFTAKKKIESSRAEKLVDNIVIEKLETILDKISRLLELKIIEIRDKQLLPRELKYLESEIEKIKKRIGTNVKSAKIEQPKKC
ncbi:hypothetical protein O3G_MSEX014491 [Manduca sexta]|uniref:Uncharacterized protein n=1 Tax=Manduca sexta TaxID=7130 RepID=A0A922CYB8_MANSE|nr:hypothetical protein O3G_MSEX014491 [Manduca sexta]